jgi:hypothetical protein
MSSPSVRKHKPNTPHLTISTPSTTSENTPQTCLLTHRSAFWAIRLTEYWYRKRDVAGLWILHDFMDLRTGHVSFPNEFIDIRRTIKKVTELTCVSFLSPPDSLQNITSDKTLPIYIFPLSISWFIQNIIRHVTICTVLRRLLYSSQRTTGHGSTFIQINQPTWCISLSDLLPVV